MSKIKVTQLRAKHEAIFDPLRFAIWVTTNGSEPTSENHDLALYPDPNFKETYSNQLLMLMYLAARAINGEKL